MELGMLMSVALGIGNLHSLSPIPHPQEQKDYLLTGHGADWAIGIEPVIKNRNAEGVHQGAEHWHG
jgi:hypothetical protein